MIVSRLACLFFAGSLLLSSLSSQESPDMNSRFNELADRYLETMLAASPLAGPVFAF